jgi:predicted component of type VI protein secretion system
MMLAMKHAVALLAAALLVSACASSDTDDNSSPTSHSGRVNVDIVQLTGPSEVQPQAPVDIQLGVGVQNISNDPVTIRRVEIQQVGRGVWVIQPGAQRSFVFNKTVPARAEDEVSFWVHAYAITARGDVGDSEPVQLRVIVFFDSPAGNFREMKQKMLQQF